MSGGGQHDELEARLRNLIVSNGPALNSTSHPLPHLPGKIDRAQHSKPEPRVLPKKSQDDLPHQQHRQASQPRQMSQSQQRQRGHINANDQVTSLGGPQKRVQQKYRKFAWQQEQPDAAVHLQSTQVPRPPGAAGQGSHQVLQTSYLPNQAQPRQAGVRYGHNQQQQRGNHNSAAPSQVQPLQRQNQHAYNQVYTMQYQYLEMQAQSMLPQIEMKPEEFMMKDSFRIHLERSIEEALQAKLNTDAPNVTLACFGSLASGFGMPGSDMDLALLSSTMPADLPRIIEKIILDMGHGAHLLTRTRVPIIKICERPTAELYQALCEERQKWDDMTPEERDQHDRGTKQEEAAGDAVKTGLQGGDGAHDIQTATASLVTAPHQTSLPQSTPTKPSLDTTASLPVDDLTSTHHEVIPLTSTITNTTTTESSTSASDTKAKSQANQKRKPWLRERKLGPLDFPKDGVGIQCDINFSNPLGLHNTTLLRCYSRCDVRVRLLILFIKSWAARRKINSARNGTLSSYGYVLMVLHYLINVAQPPVCPNLQLAASRQQNSPAIIIDGHTVHFWRNEAEIERLATKGMLTHNRQPLGVLLQGFFHYFAHQNHDSPKGGFVWTKEVLSLRSPSGLLTKAQKEWTGAKNITVHDVQVTNRYLFAIEDPFELDHNVARTVTHPGIVAIRDEFRRAWRILQFVGRAGSNVLTHDGELMEVIVEEVFDPEKDKEKEQNTENGDDKSFDGPRETNAGIMQSDTQR